MPYDSKGRWFDQKGIEDLQDELEARAKIDAQRKNFGAVDPIRKAVAGTNAAPEYPLGMVPATYYVPNKDLNASGWTNLAGETFVTPHRPEKTTGHEAFHSRMMKAYGRTGMPYAGKEPLEPALRRALGRNMERIQPDKNSGTPQDLWGLEPNRNPEEQIANLRGYEGSLPAGTPITKSPIAPQLFDTAGTTQPPRALVDYYFEKSSLPYKGVWDQQYPEVSMPQQLANTARQYFNRGLVKLGINTVNRGDPYGQ